MNLHLQNQLYRYARNNARRRQIVFEFSFEEWINWWEKQLGKRWFEKRGIGKSKYQMARFNDKGPYAVWNVKCITHSQNLSERKPSFSGHYHTVKTRKLISSRMKNNQHAFGSKRPDLSIQARQRWQDPSYRAKMINAIVESNKRRG